MQISLTDVRLESVVKNLEEQGFGLVTISCETRRQVETVSIWTQVGVDGPQGYEVGIIRRNLGSFANYEVVIDTNRIEVGRLTHLLGRIATDNR